MSVIFYILILYGFYLDFYFWRNITPLIISFSGVLIISLLYDLFGGLLGFIDVEPLIYLYILTFFFCGLIASILAAFITRKMTVNTSSDWVVIRNKIECSYKSINFFLFFTMIISIVCTVGIFVSYKSTGYFYGDDYERILSQGIIGHSYALLLSISPFLFIFSKQDSCSKFQRLSLKFLLVLILFLLFMKQVKYWVIVPMIWFFLINLYLYNKGILDFIKKSAVVLIAILLLFFMVYFYKIIISSGDVDIILAINQIANHFLGYLFSGLLVFSSMIRDGTFNSSISLDIFVIFNGGINFISTVIGQGLYHGKELIIPFYKLSSSGLTGNVGTIWATFLLYSGWYSFILFSAVIFLLSIFFCLAKRSFSFFILYTCLSSFMALCWFASYFALLSSIEVPFLSLCICVFFALFRNGKMNISKKTNKG